MSKYPFFDKKGRPSKEEAKIAKKILKLIDEGTISMDEVDELTATEGLPTNAEELETLYTYLSGESSTGETIDSQSGGSQDYDYDHDYDSGVSGGENETSGAINNPAPKVENAVDFNPFDEPVVERSYTKGINFGDEPENDDEGGLDNDDFERPDSESESVASDVGAGGTDFRDHEQGHSGGGEDDIPDAEFEEDIPEPEWSNTEGIEDDYDDEEGDDYDEDEDEGGSGALGEGNLDDMSPAQKRKSAEKTAEAIMQMYCKFAPTPFISWASFKDSKIKKLALEGKIDLNMQLENGVTVQDYIDGTNEQVKEVFEVSEETKEEIKDPLIDVLMEQELALTPTQRLLMAVGSHVVQMGFSAYQLAQNNKMALETFEKFHRNMKATQQPQQASQPSSASSHTAFSSADISDNDREAVDELISEINKGDDDILDPEHDNTVEVEETTED